MNYSELLQLAKGWGNFISDRIIIWRLLYISVAFITEDGLVPLKQVLAELRDKGIPGKILTTSYLTFTEPPDVTLIDKVRNQMQKNI